MVATVDCDLSTPSISESLQSVVVYPNPYLDTFKLKLVTNAASDFQVKVYDMIGRLIEQRKVSFDQVSQLELGNGYPSGVYNIVVTQENSMKALRVIKK